MAHGALGQRQPVGVWDFRGGRDERDRVAARSAFGRVSAFGGEDAKPFARRQMVATVAAAAVAPPNQARA